MKLIPVILSGGAGSRLWPVSRLQHPKPFIRLQDGQSLLQKAFIRATGLQNVDGLITVTNRDFFFKTEDEFGEVSHSKTFVSYILEPFGRNTAPAIAAAAITAFEEHGADAVATREGLPQSASGSQAVPPMRTTKPVARRRSNRNIERRP